MAWRMAIAKQMLRKQEIATAEIARLVG